MRAERERPCLSANPSILVPVWTSVATHRSSLDAITEGDEEEAEDKDEKDEDYAPAPRPQTHHSPREAALSGSTCVCPADDPDVVAAAALEAKVEEEELLPPLGAALVPAVYAAEAPYFVDIETGKLHWTVPAGHSCLRWPSSVISARRRLRLPAGGGGRGLHEDVFRECSHPGGYLDHAHSARRGSEHIARMYVSSIPEWRPWWAAVRPRPGPGPAHSHRRLSGERTRAGA